MNDISEYDKNKNFYLPLSNFINIFLAVLFSLSFKEFYFNFSSSFDIIRSVSTASSVNLENIFSKLLLIFITLVFFVDDGVEAQLLTINYFPYLRLKRFYIDILIYNLFYVSIILADKLSNFYFLGISFIFVLFYFWSKYSLEEHTVVVEKSVSFSKRIKLLKLIKQTCIIGFILFLLIFSIVTIFNLGITLKISIYTVVLLLIYYFIYDLLGELLLEDLEFKGTGIFKPFFNYYKKKICSK